MSIWLDLKTYVFYEVEILHIELFFVDDFMDDAEANSVSIKQP